MRILLALVSLTLSVQLASQSLVCPKDKRIHCHQTMQEEPIVIGGEGLRLVNELEFLSNSCDSSLVKIIYHLVDESEEISQTKASCEYRVTRLPLPGHVRFPTDTTVRGYMLSEVLDQSIFQQGIQPILHNDCFIEYRFSDQIVESYPVIRLFRNWVAKNLCTDKMDVGLQVIYLKDIPNQGFVVPLSNCEESSLRVDSFDLYLNSEKLDWSACFEPFDSIQNILNCASQYLINESDELELVLHYNVKSVMPDFKDLSVIQKHILGIQPIYDSCKFSAADVNSDGRINGMDLIAMMKVILGFRENKPTERIIELNGENKPTLLFTKSDFPVVDLNIKMTQTGELFIR